MTLFSYHLSVLELCDFFLLLHIRLPSIPKPSGSSNIIGINKIHALSPQLPPNTISRTDWPARLIPVSQHDTPGMCSLHLSSQQCKLRVVQTGA